MFTTLEKDVEYHHHGDHTEIAMKTESAFSRMSIPTLWKRGMQRSLYIGKLFELPTSIFKNTVVSWMYYCFYFHPALQYIFTYIL